MSSKAVLFAACMAFVSAIIAAQSVYVRTPRDTGTLPPPSGFLHTVGSEFNLVFENETLRFYYRDDRDVFAVEDRRNGYVWKTGLDVPFKRDVDDRVDEGADPTKLSLPEQRLNTTYTGIANSLVTVEYFDGSNNIKRISSAAYRDAESQMELRSADPFSADLYVEFSDIDLRLVVNVSVEENELVFRLADQDLEGNGVDRLAAISFVPFFGASGGVSLQWDPEEDEFGIPVVKPAPSGYAVVPDGSGALVRFLDNSTKLSAYVGDIYGEDLSQSKIYSFFDGFSVPHKNNYLPLYGVVHGDDRNAFLGYAASGGEYMEVIATPEDNTTFYTWVYPRFVYNRLYYQVYNKRGDGYFRTLEKRNHFDVELRYRFLAGGERHSAGYSAIATSYRNILRSKGVLPIRERLPHTDIPLRIDFLMADVRDTIIGHAHEVVTTISDVEEILDDLADEGIENISAGLLGFAKGGTVLSKPGKVNLLSALGRNRDFEDVIGRLRGRGVDVSFGRNYALIGEGQVSPLGNAIRGASGWYNERNTFLANAPVNLFYFARPDRVIEWIGDEADDMADLGASSLSVDGVGHTLFSSYSGDDAMAVSEVIATYGAQLAESASPLPLNFYRPNQYLWPITRRFLGTPLHSSQFLLETDTVPLLQMTLNGSMDLFGPYANFAFNSDAAILRMIDYNVYPSFLLTRESAHVLMMTNSAENYSTQYAVHKGSILEVYSRVNSALRTVIDAEWTGRRVLEDGVIVNTYDNGVTILVNYRESEVMYRGTVIGPLQARVLQNGGVD